MIQAAFDLNRGFLPAQDPLKKLSTDFKAWEEIAAHLPKYLLGSCFREQLQSLALFPLEKLASRAEQERAMLLLSFLGHAYVWGRKPLVDKIPAILAKPWCRLAEMLERPPVLSYASYALYNWYRINSSLPLELGNIALLQNFLGGVDEEWFVLIHVDIEEKAGVALRALLPLLEAVKMQALEAVVSGLKEIASSLEKICATLDRMPEHCDPYIYYNRVRPYIHGWKNNPSLPQGMIYEDCFDNQPQYFRGETGAQSTIIPALDCVMGIGHQEDELSIYLKEMRTYMPADHRAFLEDLEKHPSIRTYVCEHSNENSECRDLYNHCLDLITRFRFTHLKYAAAYIQKQSQLSTANPIAVGTGGTPFMDYLAKHEREVNLFKI